MKPMKNINLLSFKVFVFFMVKIFHFEFSLSALCGKILF